VPGQLVGGKKKAPACRQTEPSFKRTLSNGRETTTRETKEQWCHARRAFIKKTAATEENSVVTSNGIRRLRGTGKWDLRKGEKRV